jgi:hypothetical protein
MAHLPLGHAELARQLIEKARAWMNEADHNEYLCVDQYQPIQFHGLLREAEELLKAGSKLKP